MAQTWSLYIRSRPLYIEILCTSTMTNGHVASLELFIQQKGSGCFSYEIMWNANLMQSHGTIRTVRTTYAAALDHHPSKNSVQKTICCTSASNAPDDGHMYPKHVELRIHSFISIQPWRQEPWQEPQPSHVTGMALAHYILCKFLGVVCHCFLPPLDVPTLAARCLHPQRRERS